MTPEAYERLLLIGGSLKLRSAPKDTGLLRPESVLRQTVAPRMVSVPAGWAVTTTLMGYLPTAEAMRALAETSSAAEPLQMLEHALGAIYGSVRQVEGLKTAAEHAHQRISGTWPDSGEDWVASDIEPTSTVHIVLTYILLRAAERFWGSLGEQRDAFCEDAANTIGYAYVGSAEKVPRSFDELSEAYAAIAEKSAFTVSAINTYFGLRATEVNGVPMAEMDPYASGLMAPQVAGQLDLPEPEPWLQKTMWELDERELVPMAVQARLVM